MDTLGTPRLLGDTARSLLAFAITTVTAIALALVVRLLGGPGVLGIGTAELRTTTSLLGFVIFFITYQVITYVAWRRGKGGQLGEWVRLSTPRGRTQRVLSLLSGSGAGTSAITTAALSLAVVLITAITAELRSNQLIMVLAVLTVASSWSTVLVTFTLAYLRADLSHGGCEFPGRQEISWSDYCYLALQVSTSFSSSDVQITTTRMRRLVSRHSLVAFVFNTVIVALLVSLLLINAT